MCSSAKPLSSCRGDEVNRGSRRATAHGTVSQVKGTQSSISGRIGKSALHKREGIWIKCCEFAGRGAHGPGVRMCPGQQASEKGGRSPLGEVSFQSHRRLVWGNWSAHRGSPQALGRTPGGGAASSCSPRCWTGTHRLVTSTPSKATAFFFKKEKWGKRK